VSNGDIGRIKSPLDSMAKDLYLEDGVERYGINSHPEGGTYEASFGYPSDRYGYTVLMSDIMELSKIGRTCNFLSMHKIGLSLMIKFKNMMEEYGINRHSERSG
jgi:hypothetical protein